MYICPYYVTFDKSTGINLPYHSTTVLPEYIEWFISQEVQNDVEKTNLINTLDQNAIEGWY